MFLKRSAQLSSRGLRAFSSDGETGKLVRTALYDLHLELGGKMVPFAGYELPVQYSSESLLNNHLFCRSSAGLFDVSHMGQIKLFGAKALQFLETLTPSDLLGAELNVSKLSVLLNEKGGIIDDCIITRKTDHIFMVVNGGCKHKDLAHMRARLVDFNKKNNADVVIEYLEDRSLVALQGPKAAEVLHRLAPTVDLSKLAFMSTTEAKVSGVNSWITRCGYTGEDGFEISIPDADAVAVTRKILENPEVHPAGLGVRDSLRLEAGLCLYGHDLNEDITPVQANLNWLVGKRRREEGGYLGADVVNAQIKNGADIKRIGFNVEQGAPAREGANILDESGNKIGFVTSGTFSPSLKKAISMGYVNKDFAKIGTKIQAEVRGKINPATVTKMPWVPANYFRVQ